MPRKARQGTRPKKKQARIRTVPGPTLQRPEPIAEPAPSLAPEAATIPSRDGAPPSAQGPRVTMNRAARPYQHRRGRQVATVRSLTKANPFVLPREREYGFIRSDLRRLLLTAAVLAIMMVALLVVLEP